MTPDYLQAIAALLSAIAWPFVIVVILLTQRQPLIGFLSSVEEFTISPTGIAAKLRKELDKSAPALLESAHVSLASDPAVNEAPSDEQRKAVARVERVIRRSDISVVWSQVLQLAREYERVRASMPPGDSRTRQMELVVAKMRALAPAAYSLLRDLVSSESPGERLAAIAILQGRPDPDYLDWLATCIAKEKPFVGYHAGVALLTAVRILDPHDYASLQAAINKARESVKRGTDRDRVLSDAKEELEREIATSEKR